MLSRVLLDYIKIRTKKYACLILQWKIISLVYELGVGLETLEGSSHQYFSVSVVTEEKLKS